MNPEYPDIANMNDFLSQNIDMVSISPSDGGTGASHSHFTRKVCGQVLCNIWPYIDGLRWMGALYIPRIFERIMRSSYSYDGSNVVQLINHNWDLTGEPMAADYVYWTKQYYLYAHLWDGSAPTLYKLSQSVMRNARYIRIGYTDTTPARIIDLKLMLDVSTGVPLAFGTI